MKDARSPATGPDRQPIHASAVPVAGIEIGYPRKRRRYAIGHSIPDPIRPALMHCTIRCANCGQGDATPHE
jgi:hypothetical protein